MAEARSLFEDAEADFAAGDFVDAARAYQRSYEILVEVGRDTAPLVLFNVARAWDGARRGAEALEAYEHFILEAHHDDVAFAVLEGGDALRPAAVAARCSWIAVHSPAESASRARRSRSVSSGALFDSADE